MLRWVEMGSKSEEKIQASSNNSSSSGSLGHGKKKNVAEKGDFKVRDLSNRQLPVPTKNPPRCYFI